MKNVALWFALVTCGCLFFFANRSVADNGVARWEYRFDWMARNTSAVETGEWQPHKNGQSFQEALNQLGHSGWEVVNCFPSADVPGAGRAGTTTSVYCMLKRRL